MEWTDEQKKELERLKNTAPKAHIRQKALAVWNVTRGKTYKEVAKFMGTCRQAISKWCKAYNSNGSAGWEHKPGQGKKSKGNVQELAQYLFKSPREYESNRTRWTIKLLIEKVPSLKGLSVSGISKFLKRNNISYKRGILSLRSPDPNFFEKKKIIEEAVKEMRENEDIVVIYEDEVSFYRQPTQSWIWYWMGRKQPKMKGSRKSNTMFRVIGGLDMRTGSVQYDICSKVRAGRFAKFLKTIADKYLNYRKVYIVMDNWPVHFHDKVQEVTKKLSNVIILPLPTYSPFLNYIEKVWKWVKQRVTHAHPWADDDDLVELKTQVAKALEQSNMEGVDLLRYVGYKC